MKDKHRQQKSRLQTLRGSLPLSSGFETRACFLQAGAS
jgi:hypothetical protein